MSKLCRLGRNWIQIYNLDGDVRECGWTSDGYIGNLMNHTLPELYHSEQAKKLRERLVRQDYSKCLVDGCPYLMMGEIGDVQVELGELPEYPEELYMAFENDCNYHCRSCTIHNLRKNKTKEEIEYKSKIIEERIRQAMPYVKKTGANGVGELFTSKKILKLLSEWRPIAPAEECSVVLETNGSLFDEEHWKQIENLGQYNLSVIITVMSFDEAVYQYLSGVKYPIERIEDNLRFVKGLREKNIINELRIGTVVMPENFRTIPEFARRCIEEFGADYVRLRPYDNWGGQNDMEEFFMNIRNPKHPHYSEYKEVMKHPYLSHPKVLEQSGGNDSFIRRAAPYELSDIKWRILTKILDEPDQVMDRISKINNPVIYGMGNLAFALIKEMNSRNLSPLCIIDGYKDSGCFNGIPVYNVEEAGGEINGKDVSILVTPVTGLCDVREKLNKYCIQGEIIPIWEIIGDIEIADRLKYLNRL